MLISEDDWNKVPEETYKLILAEAKERFYEQLSQSENVTTKIIQIILVDSILIAWLADFLKGKSFNCQELYYISVAVLVIVVYYYLIKSLFPRKVILRGSIPSDLLSGKEGHDYAGDINGDNYSEAEKIKVYHYHQLVRYDKRIKKMKVICDNRAKQYKSGLKMSLILFIIIVLSFLFINP